MDISVILPVYNGGPALARSLLALSATDFSGAWELIVVDDGSTDDSASLAQASGARVLTTASPRSGPAAARNLGARYAAGDVLLFLDADVLVRSNTVSHAVSFLTTHDHYAAVFGSYDATPTCRHFVSQVKNLFHHYTHQTANPEADTFWAGCGAIHRTAFWAAGGFDAHRYPRPMIEDIELGRRLLQHGYRIGLDKTWQVTHQKCWTVGSWLWSDLRDRGIPWWRLILDTRTLPNDLNVDGRSRTAVVLVTLLAASLTGSLWYPALWLSNALLVLSLLAVGWPLYRWFAQQRGGWFALRVIPWHWAYWGIGVLSIVVGTAQWAAGHTNLNKDMNR